VGGRKHCVACIEFALGKLNKPLIVPQKTLPVVVFGCDTDQLASDGR
jgi:hypothetical protein